jgi:hypothetical protein
MKKQDQPEQGNSSKQDELVSLLRAAEAHPGVAELAEVYRLWDEFAEGQAGLESLESEEPELVAVNSWRTA